jgi:hypothetical protein
MASAIGKYKVKERDGEAFLDYYKDKTQNADSAFDPGQDKDLIYLFSHLSDDNIPAPRQRWLDSEL